jgi:hypothetical protein
VAEKRALITGITDREALSFVVTLHAIAVLESGILGALCLVGWGGYPVPTRGELRESVKCQEQRLGG